MTVVIDAAKLGKSTDILNLNIIDASLLQEIERTAAADGSSVKIVYRLVDGDTTLPTSVSAVIRFNPRADGGFGQSTCELTIDSWYTKTTDGVTDWRKKTRARLELLLPGQGEVTTAELWDQVGSLFGLTFPSTDGSNNPSLATLARWLNGIPALK